MQELNLEKDFWINRWKDGLIGWHNTEFNNSLVQYGETVFIDKSHAIFVPLCGKSLDMVWLLTKGYKVVGCELSSKACIEFFTENNIPYEVTQRPAHKLFTSTDAQSPIKIYCGDIFDLTENDIGQSSGVFDRAAYIALNNKQRQEYTMLLGKLFNDSIILIETIQYDQSIVDGPPFSISFEELNQNFSKHQLQLLNEDFKHKIGNQRFVNAGVTHVHQSTYRIS